MSCAGAYAMTNASSSASDARRGSILPIILLCLLLLGLLGFFVLDAYQDSVTRRQGRSAARAVALEVLRSLHPPAYLPPEDEAEPDPRLQLDHLRALARANGLGPLTFAPLDADSVEIGATWVSVTVHAPDPDVGRLRATVEGVPAGRIGGGRLAGPPGGPARILTGCAPLALPLTEVPYADRPLLLDFILGPAPGQARLISAGRPAVDPGSWIQALGSSNGGRRETTAPEVAVGDAVETVVPSPALLTVLRERLEGRIVILPYTHGERVRGFGRVRLTRVDPSSGAIRVVLAPSAVVRSAKAGPSAAQPGAPSASPVSPYGLALRALVRS